MLEQLFAVGSNRYGQLGCAPWILPSSRTLVPVRRLSNTTPQPLGPPGGGAGELQGAAGEGGGVSVEVGAHGTAGRGGVQVGVCAGKGGVGAGGVGVGGGGWSFWNTALRRFESGGCV